MVCLIRKIRYFKGKLKDLQIQLNFGHQHTMAQLFFFEPLDAVDITRTGGEEQRKMLGKGPLLQDLDSDYGTAAKLITDQSIKFKLVDDIDACQVYTRSYLCVALFDRKVICLPNSIMIGSRLDIEPESAGCRIAGYGQHMPCDLNDVQRRIFKYKVKVGSVTRKHDEYTFLVKGLLKKDGGDPTKIVGNQVIHKGSGTRGKIDSTFGKSGLVKVQFDNAINVNIDDQVVMNLEKPALLKIIDSHDKSVIR